MLREAFTEFIANKMERNPALMGLVVHRGHPIRNKEINSWNHTNLVTAAIGHNRGENSIGGRVAVPSLSSFPLFFLLPLIFNIYQVPRMLAIWGSRDEYDTVLSSRGNDGSYICQDP